MNYGYRREVCTEKVQTTPQTLNAKLVGKDQAEETTIA